MKIIFIDFGNVWTALSGIGSLVCAILALWSNPNLFRKLSLQILEAQILTDGNNSLLACVVVRNRREFKTNVNNVTFVFGAKKQILLFGRQQAENLDKFQTESFCFYLAQSVGDKKNPNIKCVKQLDLKDVKTGRVYVQTAFGNYSRKLTKAELNKSINAYKRIKGVML